ncbi:hypothetical protein R3P38DRAFT_3546725 [Favolaschia claudopus]|uniref:Uncharacterized protein n=1 Tax=Favolaschia claudopus TaxID=2862362 RepID=A0AAW0DYU5_9AGAR
MQANHHRFLTASRGDSPLSGYNHLREHDLGYIEEGELFIEMQALRDRVRAHCERSTKRNFMTETTAFLRDIVQYLPGAPMEVAGARSSIFSNLTGDMSRQMYSPAAWTHVPPGNVVPSFPTPIGAAAARYPALYRPPTISTAPSTPHGTTGESDWRTSMPPANESRVFDPVLTLLSLAKSGRRQGHERASDSLQTLSPPRPSPSAYASPVHRGGYNTPLGSNSPHMVQHRPMDHYPSPAVGPPDSPSPSRRNSTPMVNGADYLRRTSQRHSAPRPSRTSHRQGHSDELPRFSAT